MPVTQSIKIGSKQVTVPTGLYINGEWVRFSHLPPCCSLLLSPPLTRLNVQVEASDKSTFEVLNPATGEPLTQVSHGKQADVDLAVAAARKAFKTTWGKNGSPSDRARLLDKFADLMERDIDFLAELESVHSGKGVRIAKEIDIADSIACLRYYAGWAGKVAGETIDVSPKTKMVYTTLDPLGVCNLTTAWNYPTMLWAWKVGPALAA